MSAPAQKAPKQQVTCRITSDGRLVREYTERRRVYTGPTGRYVKDQYGRRYPLDAMNVYEYAYHSHTLSGVAPGRYTEGDA